MASWPRAWATREPRRSNRAVSPEPGRALEERHPLGAGGGEQGGGEDGVVEVAQVVG